MQERDLTIQQLQQALDAARRRCALLEMQLGAGAAPGTPACPAGPAQRGATPGGGRSGSRGGAGGGQDASADIVGMRDLMAQSALHQQKYKQIREDYNRLLYKWVGLDPSASTQCLLTPVTRTVWLLGSSSLAFARVG